MEKLKAEIESLEGVPEPLHPYYEKQESGSYRLSVEKVGGVELADTGGLLSALESERSRARSFGSTTPEDVSALRDRASSAEAEVRRLKSRDSREDAAAKEAQKIQGEQLKEERERAKRYRSLLEDRVLMDEARNALKEAGFGRKADLVASFMSRDLQFKEDEDGSVRASVVGKQGQERLIRDGDNARQMTALDLAMEYARHPDYQDLVDGSGASGGGSSGSVDTSVRREGAPRVLQSDSMADVSANLEDIASGKVIVHAMNQ